MFPKLVSVLHHPSITEPIEASKWYIAKREIRVQPVPTVDMALCNRINVRERREPLFACQTEISGREIN